MVLSLQAIDFLLASSIQDGWPLSDMDCNADGSVGDDEGDEEDATFFRSHLSSRGLSGILVGLDSARFTPCLSSRFVSLLRGVVLTEEGDSPDVCVSVWAFFPSTPLVPERLVHSARFSKKAAFSFIDPAQTARFPNSDGLSFSSTVTALSPLPKADSGDGAVAVEVVETEVAAEVVDLGWLEGWRLRLLQGGCCWPEER